MLTIKLAEDGNAVSVSIDNLPAKADLADKPDDGLDPSEKPDPIDDDFTQPEQPASDDRFAPDDAFDPDDKPVSDDRFAPQDRTAADGQFTAAGQPMANGGAQVNAPRGNGFGGIMMGFGMMAQDDTQL